MPADDATKTRLLEAAGEEFADKGFGGATVRAICARAGANVAAINYHFGDKERLYIEAVIEAHRCGMEGPDEAEMETLGGPPAEALRLFIRHFLKNVLAVHDPDDWHHALMVREMIRPTSASTTLAREVIGPKFRRLSAILRAIHPAADERRLHATAFSLIGQCLHYKLARPISRQLVGDDAWADLMDLDYLADHIAGVMLAALGIGPPLDFAGDHAPSPLAPIGGRR